MKNKRTDFARQRRAEVYRRNKMSLLREALIDEFDNKCGYCNCQLGVTSTPEVDQFFPVSLFPEKAYEPDNLVLCCSVCNRAKGNISPLDQDGQTIMLNPRTDDFSDHILIDQTGKAKGLTEKGVFTIDSLKLNRPELIEYRKIQLLENEYLSPDINENFYKNFRENIKSIQALNEFSKIANTEMSTYLKNMLFANVITCLETYLCDAFTYTVNSNRKYLRQFVETFHNFRTEKFELRNVFNSYESIQEKSSKAMLDVIYHDLPKVRGMYTDTFDIKFPELSHIYEAVLKRHDFVHRNGKTKGGETHVVTSEAVASLCTDVVSFVSDTQKQLVKLK